MCAPEFCRTMRPVFNQNPARVASFALHENFSSILRLSPDEPLFAILFPIVVQSEGFISFKK